MDEVGLGKLLQDARKQAGLTQQELCEKAELSYSTLAKIERGAIKAPSIFTIQRIAGALGLSLSQLMGDTAPVPPSAKKTSRSGVRFVYFDINGCLVRFFHRAFGRIAHDSGQPADLVETAFWHDNDAVCRGDISLAEFNSRLGQKLSMPEFDWTRYYLDAIEPIEPMRRLLEWAEANYHIGLLSNIMPGLIAAMTENGLLPDLPYAAVIDSSEVRAIKPEPMIYQTAQAKAGVAAEEILFVDDSRANIMAAERLGWKVLWFDDYRPEESVERVRTALEPVDTTP